MKNTSKTIRNNKKTEIYYEMITWSIIIVATVYITFNFPYSESSNSLIYILTGAIVASAFWYLRSRQLYAAASQDADKAIRESNEIRKQQQISTAIFEHASDGILIFDQEKRILNFSKGLEEMSGFKKSEMLGKIADQALKFSAKADIPLITDIVFLPKDFVQRKYRIGNRINNSLETKSGRSIKAEITYSTFCDPSSGRTIALIILRDLT